ncbi:PREDICTED: mRNAion termination [Prunus dulcis]|uniref:PREDICTED: mRNAion termination n=2 Tax=Prunus dulcis TaxID=3755 RepID=A0A5E4F693_PRUDU|nr:PREDICTED: mRNAion termination [Prunus dulcis]
MLMNRIHRRVSRMISQLNHLVLFVPVFERTTFVQNPSSVSLKFQCFCSSRLTHHSKVSVIESAQSPNSPFANRVSRNARTEAQATLFDYLHCTRSFSFTDAEHISKNSPIFLQNLLSNIDSEKDVARSLTRFLRYNPINEFEPFFESLGLSPSELLSFLPRHLMYLSDDCVLTDNVHALCNYGIPRSNIGKMYKEAKEIFGYDYGVLALKLQAYENLGISKATVIKLVSCCPLLLVGGVNSDFVKVHEKLKRLGLGMDWIGGYASGNSTYNWDRMFDTMDFLDKVGYTEEQMCVLFELNPALLLEGSGKNVYVLFGRLLKLGLEMNEVYSLFMQNPQVLSVKCMKNLLLAVDFLFEIGMGTEEMADIVANDVEFLSSSSFKRPKTVCKDLKVKRDGLLQMIKEDPHKVLTLASKSKGKNQLISPLPSKHLEKTSFLVRLGYIENSDEMMKALKKFRGRGDQLQERFDCLVQAGLDCNVVSNIVKQAPHVLNQSKDVIEMKISCLTNCLRYPLDSVVAFPAYLCYDMDRINLRFSMYAWLREKGAAKPMLSLSTLLACSDARFVKYYVDVHPEGPAMWESFKMQKS